ncbi:hypothetical protein DCS_00540 [Drechmeria coniospora]|uniref:Uncharacterized protein n=1 Tax=Drechmeria coniospora TaxID=98403 RepID=A0A151GQP7_DRECN|nr:hypothetical protein DCS_00540 [Drechmeria coniospora]KYK59410.1 hypothetical protein DCS_00540 [Drechmeria coniospora]
MASPNSSPSPSSKVAEPTASFVVIPAQYGSLDNSPTPGVVVAIVLGSVIAVLGILSLLYKAISLRHSPRATMVDAEVETGHDRHRPQHHHQPQRRRRRRHRRRRNSAEISEVRRVPNIGEKSDGGGDGGGGRDGARGPIIVEAPRVSSQVPGPEPQVSGARDDIADDEVIVTEEHRASPPPAMRRSRRHGSRRRRVDEKRYRDAAGANDRVPREDRRRRNRRSGSGN